MENDPQRTSRIGGILAKLTLGSFFLLRTAKGRCREGKIRTQRVAQEEWEKRRETEKLTRRRNKMESKSLPNRCQYKPGDILL